MAPRKESRFQKRHVGWGSSRQIWAEKCVATGSTGVVVTAVHPRGEQRPEIKGGRGDGKTPADAQEPRGGEGS